MSPTRAGRGWSPDGYFLHGRIAPHPAPFRRPVLDLYYIVRSGTGISITPYPLPPVSMVSRSGLRKLTLATPMQDLEALVRVTLMLYCHGIALLRNIDIFKEAGGANRALIKTFHGRLTARVFWP